VWDVLVDFEQYPDWNPFIAPVHGAPVEGARLRAALSPPGGRRVTMKARVTRAEPEAVFEWLGHLGLPGVFHGGHRVEPGAAASTATRSWASWP
jgi:hypothetical protein